jgi:hypothetical protein
MSGELFNPEAFEQIPGQLAMDQMFELSGGLADYTAREACARRNGKPEITWRVRYRELGRSGGSSIWTDACTHYGAIASVWLHRRARCLPSVEIVMVERES